MNKFSEGRQRDANGKFLKADDLAVRFWAKVQIRKGDGCWLWTGRKGSNGYGRMEVDAKDVPVTHVMWFLSGGVWPPANYQVCHHCDVKACVRPSHLFVGTKFDNMQDCARKGRNIMQRHPERSSLYRLTREQKQAAGRKSWIRRKELQN